MSAFCTVLQLDAISILLQKVMKCRSIFYYSESMKQRWQLKMQYVDLLSVYLNTMQVLIVDRREQTTVIH